MVEIQYSKLRKAVLNARKRVGRNRCAGVQVDVKAVQLIKIIYMAEGPVARLRIIDIVVAGGEAIDTLVRRSVDVPLEWWQREEQGEDILVVTVSQPI